MIAAIGSRSRLVALVALILLVALGCASQRPPVAADEGVCMTSTFTSAIPGCQTSSLFAAA